MPTPATKGAFPLGSLTWGYTKIPCACMRMSPTVYLPAGVSLGIPRLHGAAAELQGDEGQWRPFPGFVDS